MDDDIEYQLPQLFERAAARLEPPVEEIVEASTVLGRRRRRRRSAGAACAAVGVLGLTAGVVLGVQRLGIGGAPGGGAVAAAGPARGPSRTPATRPGTARPPTTGGAAASALSVSGSAVSATSTAPQTAEQLLSRLLSGYGLHAVGPQADPIGVADLVYDDGSGRSELIVSVLRYTAQLAGFQAYTCANFISADAGARPAAAPKPSCTKAKATGGLTEYLIVTADDKSGFYDYEVNLFTSNGLVVALDAGNGVPHGATVEVTRDLPPLTLAQMSAVVADPGWLAYRDAS